MTGSEQVGSLREHLLELLRGKGAHATFEDVTADWPEALRGVKPERLPYTPWQVLEHMRIAQWDIVEFSINYLYVTRLHAEQLKELLPCPTTAKPVKTRRSSTTEP